MVAPLEAAPVESVGLAEPVGYPVGVFTEVTTITAEEADRPNEAVFLSESELVADETAPAVNGVERVVSAREPKVEIVDGRIMRLVTFFDGDPKYAALTEQIVAGRREQYVNHGLLKPEAPKEDGIRGDNVEVLAVVDPEVDGPAASLRVAHAGHDYTKLPSFGKFVEADAFAGGDGAARIDEIAQGRPVAEIAALWKDPNYSPQAKVALYKEAIQRAIERDELLFLGIVTPEFRGLQRAYGEGLTQVIGEPIAVKGEDAVESVRIRPVIVDPRKAYDCLLDQLDQARASGDRITAYAKEVMFWYVLDGFDWRQHLPQSTVDRIESLPNARIQR